jgi:hypothetical protein
VNHDSGQDADEENEDSESKVRLRTTKAVLQAMGRGEVQKSYFRVPAHWLKYTKFSGHIEIIASGKFS